MQHRITFLLALGLASNLNMRALVAAEFPKPDIVAATDGSGDFKTIQEAVSSIPRDNRERMIIFIKDGLYSEKVRIDSNFVTLRGQSRQGTRIEFAQGADEFNKKPDDIGRAVVNINGNDCVLENLTIKNTHGVIGPHAFAIYGKGDKTVIVDCDVLSEGADTLALWGDRSGSYQARLNIRGSVDFVCPRGWCYMTDCTFYEMNPAAHAAIWHDGSKDVDMKFVLRNCKFDGVDNWILARHHHDGQFFLLDCTFSKRMRDLPPYRVIYPIEGDKPSEKDAKRNRDLDASNIWGERAYFYNCHRDGGDYAWHTNNLSSAPSAPNPEQITAAWMFAGKWDPERKTGPVITKTAQLDDRIKIVLDENVTVKGKPRLVLQSGEFADYVSGSGSNVLIFAAPSTNESKVVSIDFRGGSIIASEASATLRMVEGLRPQGDEHASLSNHKLRIVLAGDSTVTTNAGWGAGFAACLTTNAECINFSRGGRSSKSFIAEGRWKECLELKPDYVLIQFGHNDQPGHPDRETDPQTTYRQFMTQYVDDARAAGIKPVLITPMSRRQWGADGKIHSTLQPYVDIVKQIAAEKNVPLIDLHARAIELYEILGKEKIYELSPLKDSYATNSVGTVTTNKVHDGTHLNAQGSEIVGPIVAQELAKVVPELAPYVNCVSLARGEAADWGGNPIAPITAPFPMPQLERPAFPDRVADIREYGAVEGGTTANTGAFAKAIEACANKGGGRVLVPAGRWLTGPIHLRSNIDLHLAEGSELVFSDRFEDYLPLVFVRVGGIELYNYSPLIYANGCENVAITGPGRLNGNAKAWWEWKSKETKEFFQMGARGVPVDKRVFGTPEAAIRPSFVSFVNCKNVLLEGFTIGSGPNWTIHPVYCDNIIIRRVTVDTDGPNNDGIDPDSCRNMLIEHCRFSTGDDCVVLKSGYNEDGWRVGRPTENVVMRHCFSERGHGGLVIGSEMSGDVRNVYMHDCEFKGTDRAVRIKSLRGRGGVVENVWAENLKVWDMKREVVILNMDYGSDRNPASNLKPPVFRNMTIRNIVGIGAPAAILLQGLDDSPIENIRFENLTIASSKGVVCNNVRKITFAGVGVKPSRGPVFELANATEIEILGAKAPPGTNVFLKLEGKNSRDIRIRDSDLVEAKLMFSLGDGVPANAVTVE